MKREIVLSLILLAISITQPAYPSSSSKLIKAVSTSRAHFNPSQGESVSIEINVSSACELSVNVLDRDGFRIRNLFSGKKVSAGRISLDWDGRTDGGAIVADEAYSLKIDLISSGKRDTYFPANSYREQVPVQSNYYDRRNGLLSYYLEKPSRVHILATSGHVNNKTDEFDGAILKVINNREPRLAGAVLEHWRGFDESGTILVSDLPDFGISIVAEPLPENSIISVGNRRTSFLQTTCGRRGQSLIYTKKRAKGHEGLISSYDFSPRMHIKPVNAVYSSINSQWQIKAKTLKLACTFEGPTATRFLQQAADLLVFIDSKKVKKIQGPHGDFYLEVPLEGLSSDSHIIALNWDTNVGPVIAASLRLKKMKT
jgi:hypothetical protein